MGTTLLDFGENIEFSFVGFPQSIKAIKIPVHVKLATIGYVLSKRVPSSTHLASVVGVRYWQQSSWHQAPPQTSETSCFASIIFFKASSSSPCPAHQSGTENCLSYASLYWNDLNRHPYLECCKQKPKQHFKTTKLKKKIHLSDTVSDYHCYSRRKKFKLFKDFMKKVLLKKTLICHL